jgi:DNA-binding transcriptional LysR family regulator
LAELSHLRTFLAVYRAGSLSRAADGLHLSQPAVSAHLKALEGELRKPLFLRLARGVAPTSPGHALARDLAPHMDALEAIARAHAIGAGRPAVAHLGGPADLLATKALPALAPLVRQDLRLRVRTGLADELLEALAGNELDLVIATRRGGRRDLDFEQLFEEELVLVASPRRAALIGHDAVQSRGAGALAGVPLVAFDEGLPIIRRYFRVVFGCAVRGSASVVVDDLRAVRQAVAVDAGISVLPRYVVAEALQRGELVELHRPATPPMNVIFLARRPGPPDPIGALIGETLKRAAPEWERR